MRNTHAGLRGISPALLESARALGLPPRAILGRIELPLASPLILAGIKSAAIINVGTATLGALVGAGGLGEPIFTGIRLDDVALIMEGALPASALALLVQGVFELIERVAVPAGLQPPALDHNCYSFANTDPHHLTSPRKSFTIAIMTTNGRHGVVAVP